MPISHWYIGKVLSGQPIFLDGSGRKILVGAGSACGCLLRERRDQLERNPGAGKRGGGNNPSPPPTPMHPLHHRSCSIFVVKCII
jgi:hypothetical protein